MNDIYWEPAGSPTTGQPTTEVAPPPLNGTKTHPLTKHALEVLRRLRDGGPEPSQTINPGVVNRFHREGLTETVMRQSPFAIHRGGKIRFEQITDAGRSAISKVGR